MDIITQTFLTTVIDTFLKEWRAETMIAIIVFLLTYYFMQKRINKLKQTIENQERLIKKYEQDTENTIKELKTFHNAVLEMKNILTNYKDKQDKEILLQQIENIVKNISAKNKTKCKR